MPLHRPATCRLDRRCGALARLALHVERDGDGPDVVEVARALEVAERLAEGRIVEQRREARKHKHLGDLRLLLFELLLVDVSHPGEGLDAEEGAEGGLAVLARGRDGGEHLLPFAEVRARACVTAVTRASVSAFRTCPLRRAREGVGGAPPTGRLSRRR